MPPTFGGKSLVTRTWRKSAGAPGMAKPGHDARVGQKPHHPMLIRVDVQGTLLAAEDEAHQTVSTGGAAFQHALLTVDHQRRPRLRSIPAHKFHAIEHAPTL